MQDSIGVRLSSSTTGWIQANLKTLVWITHLSFGFFLFFFFKIVNSKEVKFALSPVKNIQIYFIIVVVLTFKKM